MTAFEPAFQPSTRRKADNRNDIDHEVLIIGAGIGGLGVAIRLLGEGLRSIRIIERADRVGGTWRDNRYPGIAVDINSFTYSYSFEQNPNWSRLYAPGHELQAYVERVAAKYGLYAHLQFNVTVLRTEFDEQAHVWVTTCTDGSVIKSRHIVSATGGLITPKLPEIPGIESFQGEKIHTGNWDRSYQAKGRRIAVIGTGATAVQLVPELARSAGKLSVFQRTPIWVLPKHDFGIGAALKSAHRAIPGLQRLTRFGADLVTESVMVLTGIYYNQAPWMARYLQRLCLDNLRTQLPDRPDLHEKLTPRYGFGCKRPTFSNEYFKCLARDNVALVTEGIERITPNGIRTRDGVEHEFDTLVFATGYRVFEKGNVPNYQVFGRGGLELGEFWEEHRHQAYQGVTVPGFPNFFMVLGPYGLIGTSYFKTVEGSAIHLARCIREARRQKKTCVEVRQDVHDRYFHKTLERQKNTVFFNNHCGSANSYYFDQHGDAPLARPSTSYEMFASARWMPMDRYHFT